MNEIFVFAADLVMVWLQQTAALLLNSQTRLGGAGLFPLSVLSPRLSDDQSEIKTV